MTTNQQLSPMDLIACLLKYDEMPPDEDYSHYEFGERMAAETPSTLAQDVVKSCLRQLPASLAASFLDGFLQIHRSDDIKKSLISVIPEAREVTSAGNIVEWLQGIFEMSNSDIFELVRKDLVTTNASDFQDRLSYAVWALVCRENYHVESEEVRFAEGVPLEPLKKLVSEVPLSEYSKETLTGCIDVLSK